VENIIFCSSPFQVLVAKEVVQTVSEDFIGIYLKVSDDQRQTYYAERMKEFCKEVIVLEGKTVLDDMQEALKGKFISNLYLASLDNPVALNLFNPSTMNLYTFDDGSTSIVPLNFYTQGLDRTIQATNFTMREIMSFSTRHYTVFNDCILFPKEKQVFLKLHLEPSDFHRAKNGKKISVFLGQFLASLPYQESFEITNQLTSKILDEKKIDYYYPHPRVPLSIHSGKLKETKFCFEEEIYLLLEEYEFVEVHSFYSTALLLIKDIEGVSVHGYRTFLTTHESDIFAKLGIPYQNVSQSDTQVDIIMPTYNNEETIQLSIESVLNQTHENFNLMIVDDGSTDRTEEICKSYHWEPRIKYFKKEHGGISKALNFGISKSNSIYIARQDADDVWAPWHLGLLLYRLEKESHLDIIGAKVIAEEDKLSDKLAYNDFNELSGEVLWLYLAYRNFFNHSTVIFKRSAYDEAGGYHSDFDGMEDWHLWARLVTKDNALILNTVTTYYRLSNKYRREMAFRLRLAKSRGLSLEEVLKHD